MSEDEARVGLAEGGGGVASRELVEGLLAPAFANPWLAPLDDQARLSLADLTQHGDRLAFTTDSYVVSPLVFPGGDIGKLAVCGTLNDLAVGGARPLFLSCALILEEGLARTTLEGVVASVAAAARDAGVAVVTGDTKVVERGACDGIFINTAGLGVIPAGRELGVHRVAPGDRVLVTGPIGDHGATILAARGELLLEAELRSDCAALHRTLEALFRAAPGTRFCRDATRGGLASVLVELARGRGLGLELDERAIPLRPAVSALCELLGLDPLYLANEGTALLVVPERELDAALASLGPQAAQIGVIVDEHPGRVVMNTAFGGRRIVDALVGEQLPRIC